jgi:hypothetical protein
MEEWKCYCEGVYVSNTGRVVRDYAQKGSFNPRFVNGSYDKCGYLRISINGKNKNIHRLIGELFIPNPENKPTIDHCDRIRDFNIVSNLRWATRKEQCLNQNLRKDNKLREKYISMVNKPYVVAIPHLKVRKYFKTLKEAKIFRDNLI